MEFQQENGTATKNGAATEVKNNAAQNGAAKTNGVAKATNGNGKAEVKDVKPTPGKAEPGKEATSASTAGQPKAEETKKEEPKAEELKKEEPKAEEPKKEEPKSEVQQPTPEAAPVKKELSLETKLKAVEDLHRITIQRLSLITRMRELEGFEVKLMEEGDEIENNPYQGCKLIIQDDKKREFVTMTPGLIRMVAQFIFDSCAVKLEEIEAKINFPTA